MGMAGKEEEAKAGGGSTGDWLETVFQQLKALTDEAIAVTVAAGPPENAAEAEKRARAIGVIARTAKAVAALKASPRKPRDPKEDGMREDDHDIIDDAEEIRMRADIQSRVDHLFKVAEKKGFGPAGPGGPFPAGPGAGRQGLAEAEGGSGLAG